MAERVLSIEIGYSLTKVCEIEKNGRSPKILNSFVFATPPGTINDGIIGQPEVFVGKFKELLTAKKIKTRKAVFTVSSGRIVTKEVNIPFVKENKIKDVVRANLGDYFPVDLSSYMFAHSVIGIVRDKTATSTEAVAAIESSYKDSDKIDDGEVKPNKKKVKLPKESASKAKATGYKIMVLAAPKLMIDGYEKLAKNIGLELSDVDYNGNSIYQATKDQYSEGVQLIAKIDERSSQIMVLDNGAIALNRTIPYGIDEAIVTLQSTKELGFVPDYENAIDLVRRKTVLLGNFNGELMATDADGSDSESVFAEKKMVTDSLRNLANGLLRVIDYYNSNHSDHTIDKVFITGIGADFSGIGTLLTNEIGLKVKNLTRLANIDVKKAFQDATFGEFVTVIGATISAIKFYPDHEDNKGKQSSGKGFKNSTLLACLVFMIGILAAVFLFATTFIQNAALKSKKAKYEAAVATMQPSYDIYQQYLLKEKNVNYLQNMDKAIVNRNQDLMDFVKFMEEKMPSTFCVSSMVSDLEHVEIEATVGSKDEVAYAVSKLKECESFVSAEMTAVSLVETELGEILYGFTVDLYYAPMAETVEEEE